MNGNEFLYCTPTVFVIGKEYEILINLNACGICFVKIGEELYYEELKKRIASSRRKENVTETVTDTSGSYGGAK